MITRRGMVAALAVACLALPSALGVSPATAEPKGGAGSHDALCDAWYGAFEQDVDQAASADRRGDADGRDEALEAAEKDLAQAQQAGCEWALRVVPPTRIAAPPTGAHPAS